MFSEQQHAKQCSGLSQRIKIMYELKIIQTYHIKSLEISRQFFLIIQPAAS